jgi:ferric-dicitrate binding protein FerR (iron transport regulator)
MQLPELQEIVQKYRAGISTPEETRLVEAWFMETEKESVNLSATERADIEARLLHKLRLAIPAPQLARRRSLLHSPFLRIAAIFLVLAFAGIIGYQYQRSNLFNPVENRIVQTGRYEIRHVLLPESTVVALYHNSTLSYPVQYRGAVREVFLEGKGYFEVYKHADQPFVVHTGAVAVQVLGTSFVVSDGLQDSVAAVSVLTGKVNVRSGEQSLAMLGALQGISYHKAGRRFSLVPVADAAALTGWIDKQLVFRETSMVAVLKALEKQYHLTVRVQGTAAQEKVFTGQFTVSDSLADILDVITISTGLQHRQLNDSTIILSE